jgi:hypothetical protein
MPKGSELRAASKDSSRARNCSTAECLAGVGFWSGTRAFYRKSPDRTICASITDWVRYVIGLERACETSSAETAEGLRSRVPPSTPLWYQLSLITKFVPSGDRTVAESHSAQEEAMHERSRRLTNLNESEVTTRELNWWKTKPILQASPQGRTRCLSFECHLLGCLRTLFYRDRVQIRLASSKQ